MPNIEASHEKFKEENTDLHKIKGYDLLMNRLKKGRMEQAFRKKMTERSEFSATHGMLKAKQEIQHGVVDVPVATFNLSVHHNKYKSFGNDGA